MLVFLIPILYLKTSATAEGGMYKHVQCEACQCQYAYKLDAIARAGGPASFFGDGAQAQETLSKQARDHLQQFLRTHNRLVSCPECGWYQSEMISCRNKKFFRGFVPLALSVVAVFGLLALLAPNKALPLGGVAVGVGLLAWRPILGFVMNPNRTTSKAKRIEIGLREATSKAEMDEMAKTIREWAESLVGLSSNEAGIRAAENGYGLRVLIQDGAILGQSGDFFPGRVSVVIENDVITRAVVG